MLISSSAMSPLSGAITRFCSKRLKMRTTAVELNPRVIDACRHWFRLPADGPALAVLQMNAQRFVDDGLAATIKWYSENQDWVDNIRNGAYREYYRTMYGSAGN